MKIVTYNVNSIRARLHHLEALIEEVKPNIISLQEIKCSDNDFPEEAVREMGYSSYIYGQKSYHGVAILSDIEPSSVVKGLLKGQEESQKRFISAVYTLSSGEKITVMNGYFPQGESRDHPTKFPEKKEFYANLLQLLKQNYSPSDNIVIMGDMNVAPDDLDVGIGEQNAKRWLRTGKCCFLPEEREWLEALLDWGLKDIYAVLNPEQRDYSWFDYRTRGFDSNRGLRIDLMLATEPVMKMVKDCRIDQTLRGGERPSDHCPVILELNL